MVHRPLEVAAKRIRIVAGILMQLWNTGIYLSWRGQGCGLEVTANTFCADEVNGSCELKDPLSGREHYFQSGTRL